MSHLNVTHFVFNNLLFQNSAVYEIMWKNVVEPDRPQMNIWRMHLICWIPKATDTHSKYVTYYFFYSNNDYSEALQCYFVRPLSVVLTL